MRTYTEQELEVMAAAEQELDAKHGLILLDDSPAAKANALLLNEYFNNHNVRVSVPSMVAAAQAIRTKLTWKSPVQMEFSDILARLTPVQCQVVSAWINKQRRLETQGDEGLRNVNQVVSWLLNRNFEVSESGLDKALSNVQYNSPRPLFWHDVPKQSREYVGGRPNHAFAQTKERKTYESNEREYINGRKNHAVQTKADELQPSVPTFDAWQQIVNRYMTQWTTHSQKATLQAEYDHGIARGKSWREIGTALGRIVKGWERGR